MLMSPAFDWDSESTCGAAALQRWLRSGGSADRLDDVESGRSAVKRGDFNRGWVGRTASATHADQDGRAAKKASLKLRFGWTLGAVLLVVVFVFALMPSAGFG